MCKNGAQEKTHNLLIIIGFILLIFTLFSFSACIGERIAPIKVQNNTEDTLSIFINGERIGDVAPGAEIKNKLIWTNVRFIIEARNSQGQTVYKEKISIDDMERMDWKVIISPKTEIISSDNITQGSDNNTRE